MVEMATWMGGEHAGKSSWKSPRNKNKVSELVLEDTSQPINGMNAGRKGDLSTHIFRPIYEIPTLSTCASRGYQATKAGVGALVA